MFRDEDCQMSGLMKEIAGPFELKFIHDERSAIDVDSRHYRWARDNCPMHWQTNRGEELDDPG
jgi:hypothetical protein